MACYPHYYVEMPSRVDIVDKLSDAELVALARSGDKEAFGALAMSHLAMARRVARGLLPDEDIARELAGEAVLQAYLSLDRLRDPERFQSWLYGIVLNVCRGYLKSREASVVSLEALTGGLRFDAVPFMGFEPDPQEVAEAQQLHRVVLDAVNALSPKQRAATLLFYYDQLSVREVAATLGISTGAVRVRLHKSRGRLRELLQPAFREIRGPVPQKQEEPEMIEVTIADIMASKGSTDEKTGRNYPLNVVLLLDAKGRRVLPLWIGQTEAQAIALALKQVPLPRPLTHSFTASLLVAVGAELQEVRVEELIDDTFYAVAKLRSGDDLREVDARPSDAMALAVITGSPIYVAEEVMRKGGATIPDEAGELMPLGKGIDRIASELEEQTKAGRHGSKEVAKAEKEVSRMAARQRIIDLFVGGESESEDDETQAQ